jgi:hypothetical protein
MKKKVFSLFDTNNSLKAEKFSFFIHIFAFTKENAVLDKNESLWNGLDNTGFPRARYLRVLRSR